MTKHPLYFRDFSWFDWYKSRFELPAFALPLFRVRFMQPCSRFNSPLQNGLWCKVKNRGRLYESNKPQRKHEFHRGLKLYKTLLRGIEINMSAIFVLSQLQIYYIILY